MAAAKLSRNIKLTGTDSVDPKSKTLRAGALSVEFGNGALRYIRVGDVEVIRAIAFLVRDKNWGTFAPEISNLKLSQKQDGFAIRYHARCGDAQATIAYDATITCNAAGDLDFEATATPEQNFTTNRTGFVVLHPLKGVAGFPVEVEYTSGKKEKSKFPALVNPACPFTDIRALKHKVMDGLSVTCRMEGYAFEMEDHRNWSDASFKTYVRPLAEPWPYTMPAGKSFTQKVSLRFTGKMPRPKKAGAAKKIDVTLGRPGGAFPELGVAVPMEEAAASMAAVDAIKSAGPKHLVCHIDARESDIAGPMRNFKRLADATGAAVILEVLLPGKAPAEQELARVAAAARDAGVKPSAVSTSPAVDLKGTLPGSKFPDAPSFAEQAAAVRKLFPGAHAGGGMFSFFTELNRKRPPEGVLDYVTHTTSPIVHAADDVSVMETLESHPYQIKTTRSFLGKIPYHLGPSTIPARNNPYGASSVDNPNNERVCLSKIDPRQRGIFGAAWSVGYVSAWAKGGVQVVTLGATTGPAGMVYARTAHKQPYFDDLKGTSVYPVYHLIKDLAAADGSKLIATEIGDEGKIAAIAYKGKSGPVLWLANLTAQPQTVRVQGFEGAADIAVLDEGSFVKATTDLAFLAKSGKKSKKVGSVALRPYAVTRIASAK